jgi:uncharacterized paraquat-inducible protein A
VITILATLSSPWRLVGAVAFGLSTLILGVAFAFGAPLLFANLPGYRSLLTLPSLFISMDTLGLMVIASMTWSVAGPWWLERSGH